MQEAARGLFWEALADNRLKRFPHRILLPATATARDAEAPRLTDCEDRGTATLQVHDESRRRRLDVGRNCRALAAPRSAGGRNAPEEPIEPSLLHVIPLGVFDEHLHDGLKRVLLRVLQRVG